VCGLAYAARWAAFRKDDRQRVVNESGASTICAQITCAYLYEHSLVGPLLCQSELGGHEGECLFETSSSIWLVASHPYPAKRSKARPLTSRNARRDVLEIAIEADEHGVELLRDSRYERIGRARWYVVPDVCRGMAVLGQHVGHVLRHVFIQNEVHRP
jgi:hypothetical protein